MTDTLKSICEQYTYLNNPRFDFIPNELPRHREIIMRDLKELVSAASDEAELEKTVTVLAGTLLEAVLYTFLQSQQDYIAGFGFSFNPEALLSRYVDIFNKSFQDVLPKAVLPNWVVEHRNLVHINRELNSPPDVCWHASRDMLKILNTLLGELSQFSSR